MKLNIEKSLAEKGKMSKEDEEEEFEKYRNVLNRMENINDELLYGDNAEADAKIADSEL
jgi:Ethanolamine utilization protein EutJ (predicted chaperonin)